MSPRDRQEVISVHRGQDFRIELDSNPSTGYAWELAAEASEIRLTGQEYTPEGARPGAGGKACFRFAAIKAGTCTIRLQCRRSWEAEPIERREYRIEISG